MGEQRGLGEYAAGLGDVADGPGDGARTVLLLAFLLGALGRWLALDLLLFGFYDPVVELGLGGFLHPVKHAEENIEQKLILIGVG